VLLLQDLCRFCAKERVILPGLEAFEMLLELPPVYVVFYDYFFKSSVGDAAWKRNCEGQADMTAELGSPTEEAFAMVLLKNNYYAWLFQAKEEMQGLLVTDYDKDAKRKDFKSIHKVYLLMEIDMEETREEMLVMKGQASYNEIKKKTEEKMKDIRRRAQHSMEYQKVLEKLEEASELSDDEANENVRHKKKRRKLRDFKAYTSQKEGEGKFKGWSSRVASDMSSIVAELTEAKEEQKKFNFIYRRICSTRTTKKDGKKPARQEKVAEDVINKCDDLERIEMIAL
jgi:hypothetical protein